MKEETKLFPRILSEVQEISQNIQECCKKICLLDQILCEKIVFKYKDEVVKYEQAEIKGLNEEERKLEYGVSRNILKDLKVQIRDLQLQEILVKAPQKPKETVTKELKDVKAVRDQSSLDDFLNS